MGAKPESRCDDDNANDDGVTALQACRVTCGTCPDATEATPAPTAAPSSIVTEAPTGACHDSTSWFYSGDDWKTCAYVAQELKRCKDSNVNDDGISALEACPVTCDTCDAAPSSKPTAAPVIVDTGDDQLNAGGRRGRAPPGGRAEPDGRRSREGVLGREPGRVERFRVVRSLYGLASVFTGR